MDRQTRMFFAVVWAISLFAIVPIAVSTLTALAQDSGEGGSTSPDSMSTYVLWSIAAGFIGSWVMALLNQTQWPSTWKFATVFVWCVVASAITAYYKRELDVANWSRSLIIVFLASQVMYAAAKPAIKEVEAATTLPRGSA